MQRVKISTVSYTRRILKHFLQSNLPETTESDYNYKKLHLTAKTTFIAGRQESSTWKSLSPF